MKTAIIAVKVSEEGPLPKGVAAFFVVDALDEVPKGWEYSETLTRAHQAQQPNEPHVDSHLGWIVPKVSK